jgi:hypothetical protein
MTGYAPRYTVRKQSSGRTASVTFYVYDLQRKGRVTVHAARSREAAQHEADALNVSDLVRDYADDPRPYAERLAEAAAAYAQLVKASA